MSWRDRARILSEVLPSPVPEVPKDPSGTFGTTPPGPFGSFHVTPPRGLEQPAPAREARRAKVVAILRTHGDQQRAFDVVDAPLEPGPGEPVSVVVAVRHGGQILSGELTVPRERWSLPAFIAFMEGTERLQ